MGGIIFVFISRLKGLCILDCLLLIPNPLQQFIHPFVVLLVLEFGIHFSNFTGKHFNILLPGVLGVQELKMQIVPQLEGFIGSGRIDAVAHSIGNGFIKVPELIFIKNRPHHIEVDIIR